MDTALDKLLAAGAEVDEAEARYRIAVRDAIRDGMTRQRVHEVTGLARTTINRWLEETRG